MRKLLCGIALFSILSQSVTVAAHGWAVDSALVMLAMVAILIALIVDWRRDVRKSRA
jgi:CHASE2 domain-containing sensor protein